MEGKEEDCERLLVADEAEKFVGIDRPVEITNAEEFVAPGGGGGGKG